MRGRRRGRASPSSPAAPRPAGLTGFEWAVGVPGSIGGAVRMNAGGHGSDMAAALRGVRVVDLRTGEDGRVPAADARPRLPPLGGRARTRSWCAAELALAPGDRGRGRGRASPRSCAWRREQPARRPERRLGVHQPARRLRRPAHRRRRAPRACGVGTAEVSTKHANFIQADEGGRADDVVALMARGAGAWCRATPASSCDPETRLVGFDRRPST